MSLIFDNYDLPTDLIAQKPLSPRDSSRLLVAEKKGEKLNHQRFSDLVKILRKDDVLVLNKTKVIKARFLGSVLGENKNYKGEILLLNPLENGNWLALSKPGKRFLSGRKFLITKKGKQFELSIRAKRSDGKLEIEFPSFPGLKALKIINFFGETPLPPYIKNPLIKDKNYQTVFSKNLGSVAAPTAGLHFTKKLLNSLRKKGVKIEYITLHVGIGTFATIKENDFRKHVMHSEEAQISPRTAQKLNGYKEMGKRIIAVGTTSVRTLEAFYDKRQKVLCSGKKAVDLFIYPPYKFGFVDGMITNFHLPKTTLLILVNTFLGPKLTKKLYTEAIKNRYRFYSFGDATLLI